MVTVAEIKQELKKLKVDEEVVKKTKGKRALEELLKKSLPDDYVPEYEIVSKMPECKFPKTEESIIPKIGDSKWHDYVMTLFEEDEIYKGNPTVDGLRRVATKLFGQIVNIDIAVIKPITLNDPTVTVEFTLRFGHFDCSYSGIADATSENIKPPYNKFLTAMAETRAEGRALKRALCLKRVISAEEMEDVGIISSEEASYRPRQSGLSDMQTNLINIICGPKPKGLDIDVSNMDAAEEIVSIWLKQKGYFYIPNIRIPRSYGKEIDF